MTWLATAGATSDGDFHLAGQEFAELAKSREDFIPNPRF